MDSPCWWLRAAGLRSESTYGPKDLRLLLLNPRNQEVHPGILVTSWYAMPGWGGKFRNWIYFSTSSQSNLRIYQVYQWLNYQSVKSVNQSIHPSNDQTVQDSRVHENQTNNPMTVAPMPQCQCLTTFLVFVLVPDFAGTSMKQLQHHAFHFVDVPPRMSRSM